MKKSILKFGMYFGILAFILYLSYSFIGHLLWKEYNPITMDISSLSAVGAPNQEIIGPINIAYHISMVIFLVTFIAYSFSEQRNTLTKTGSILLFLMEIISVIGYKLFPLEGDKTVMTFQNMMHIIVTIAVVFISIAALYVLASGYHKTKNNEKFGKMMYILATIFLIFGFTNPLVINLKLNLMGLSERLAIYSLHLFISIIAIYNIFLLKKENI